MGRDYNLDDCLTVQENSTLCGEFMRHLAEELKFLFASHFYYLCKDLKRLAI